jgi:hypothetical protein
VGLRDRIDRIERGEPEEAPRCEVCGQSYAHMRTVIEDLDARGGFSQHGGAKPCEACEQARQEWGRATGRVNLIRIVYAPTREELGRWRDERGHVDDEP